jgi:hypothetical protein
VLRKIIFLLAFPINLVHSQPPKAQSIEIAGYVLTLGMTTDALLKGFGTTFKYTFDNTTNSYTFEGTDRYPLSEVRISSGRVIMIDKFFWTNTDRTKNDKTATISAYNEFVNLRKTASCTLRKLDFDDIAEMSRFSTITMCGNVQLESRYIFEKNIIGTVLFVVRIG